MSTIKKPIKRKEYEKQLRKLQVELCALQDWVKHKGLRVVVVFEGRDAAGKGGTIKAITERVSPRVFRVVALPAPSDREKGQLYLQRYIAHFPTAGEIVIFDRSWYNRAGVEYVMGFCTEDAASPLPQGLPRVRTVHRRRRHPAHQILAGGQRRGAEAPLRGPHRRSAASVEAEPDGPVLAKQMVRVFAGARHRCSRPPTRSSRHGTLSARTTKGGRASIAFATYSNSFHYEKLPRKKSKLPDRSMDDAYDDLATLEGIDFVPETA